MNNTNKVLGMLKLNILGFISAVLSNFTVFL